MAFTDYYRILDIPKYATQEEIRKAYLEKMDALNQTEKNSPENLRASIQKYGAAYAVLSDETEKRKYDEVLERYLSGSINLKASKKPKKKWKSPFQKKAKKPNYIVVDADTGEVVEAKKAPIWAVALSWVDLYFFQSLTNWIIELLLMFSFWALSDFGSLNIGLRCLIILIGCPTALGIFFAPLGYGVAISVSASESLASSSKGARYIVFATYIVMKHLYSLILYNLYPEYYEDVILLNIESLYMVVYGIVLGMTGTAVNKS